MMQKAMLNSEPSLSKLAHSWPKKSFPIVRK
jgi:hypothetical protein